MVGVVALITMTFGALLSFGPALVARDGPAAAPLLFIVFGVARAVSRPLAGVLCDQSGAMPVVLASALVLAAGCLVLGAWSGMGGLITGATLYGAGLGGISNATYVAMLDRIKVSVQALASASWSTAFDGGVALGGAMFAAVVQLRGIGAVSMLLPIVAALASVAAGADWARMRLRRDSSST